MGLAERTFAVIFVFACFAPLFEAIDPLVDHPLVNTTKGEVRGWYVESKATEGKYMRAFKGIPFAKPPVKELRFLDPVEVGGWNETKNLSSSEPPVCAQLSLVGNPATNEDCLYLNVYTPENVNSSSQLPVMVWIYGGAFIVGSSSSSVYGADFLVDQGVVFVSMNYRLGALGFLNLGTDKVPGNAGLKDQLLALKWVQTEIGNFGGDPTKVTLFGFSAGAASVVSHYVSPKTEGLFSYAIAESGNPLAAWPFLESGFIEIATAFSQRINCSLVNNTFDLTCLQSVKVEDIIANQNVQTYSNITISINGLPFVPSLEKTSAAALLNDTPANLARNLVNSERTKRPILTGINKDEGILLLSADPNYYKRFYSMLQDFIPENIRKKKNDAQIAKDVAALKTFYFNNTEPSLSNLRGYINFFTDQSFGISTASFARIMAANTKVYLYHFEFSGDYNVQDARLAPLNLTNVVNHGDELAYIFSRFGLNQSAAVDNTTSKKTLKRMVKLWTNFAKYGNPTPDGTTDNTTLENFLWPPCSVGSYHYAIITDHLNMSTDNFKEEAVKLWDEISFGTRTSCSFAVLSFVLLLRIFL